MNKAIDMRGLRPRAPCPADISEEIMAGASGSARLAFAAGLRGLPVSFLLDLLRVLNARVLQEIEAGRYAVARELMRRHESIHAELEERTGARHVED